MTNRTSRKPADPLASVALPAALVEDWSREFRLEDTLVESSPAFLLGWQVHSIFQTITEPTVPNMNRAFMHQHGGHACLQSIMVGLVLPIAANLDYVPGEAQMLRALGLLGDDGSGRLKVAPELRAIAPVLEDSWLTAGTEFDRATLTAWDGLTAIWTPGMPPLVRGWEAQLEFGGVGNGTFEGWLALSVGSHPIEVQRVTVAEVTRLRLRQLEDVGRRLRLPAPGCWLLWDNSD